MKKLVSFILLFMAGLSIALLLAGCQMASNDEGTSISKSSAKAITAFGFTTPAVVGVINESAKTIAVTVPYGTNVTALVASFVTTGENVKVGSVIQVSGVTANDFTNPVIYTETAADGTTVSYVVTVNVVSDQFIAIWNTLNFGSGTSLPNQVKLPLVSSGTYNFTVEWGDGSQNTITAYNDPSVTHTYPWTGTYTITITGTTIKGFSFKGSGDALKLLEIKQWGSLNLGNDGDYFNGCENLKITATDILDLSGTSNMNKAFCYCFSITTIPSMNNWDVSSVTNMASMFYEAKSFNQDIGNWNVSNVIDMNNMFFNANSFNQNIGNWNVSNVTDMNHMFAYASLFNQDIGNWNVSNVTDMNYMFSGTTSFNQNIGNWNVSNVTDMYNMFAYASSFNQDIGNWKVLKVTTMGSMFYSATSFNQDIGNWSVSNVTNMNSMFCDATSFNKNINWDVSNVTNMGSMFSNAQSFNQNISNWNVSNVTDMNFMFSNATSFNQNIGNWNVSNVKDMHCMFYYATSFNQDISNWKVLNVTNMRYMFYYATSFNQNIGNWNVSNVTDMSYMFDGIALSTINYDALLKGWASRTEYSGVGFSGGNSKYSPASSDARSTLIGTYGWTITDGGLTP